MFLCSLLYSVFLIAACERVPKVGGFWGVHYLEHRAVYCLFPLSYFIFSSLFTDPKCNALKELYERFYLTLNDSIPCFRLTNADSQIGCSGQCLAT